MWFGNYAYFDQIFTVVKLVVWKSIQFTLLFYLYIQSIIRCDLSSLDLNMSRRYDKN